MNWEETILHVRKIDEFKDIIKNSYLSDNLVENVELYRNSVEFSEIKKLLQKYDIIGGKILDVGSGNGITAVSFSLLGFDVYCVEPDFSNTVGNGAIRFLKNHYSLDNLHIYGDYCEELKFENSFFDVVFSRQCMHHALDLNKFVFEMSRVLRKSGLFFTVRDHVVFNDLDKAKFLENHALHQFYLGENAFLLNQYIFSIENANLKILEILKYYDSDINLFPKSSLELENMYILKLHNYRLSFKIKYPFLSKMPLVFLLFKFKNRLFRFQVFSELKIPGRMYSFIALKK